MSSETPNLGPVGRLLSDPNKWDQERDCSTNKNRLTKPTNEHCVKWSVRAATELAYETEWPNKMRHFMTVANKYYPGYTYKELHPVLSHESMMFLIKEAKL